MNRALGHLCAHIDFFCKSHELTLYPNYVNNMLPSFFLRFYLLNLAAPITILEVKI